MKIAPGFIKVQLTDNGEKVLGGMVNIYDEKKSIKAKVINTCEWRGDEFLSPSQQFFFNFVLTGWLFRIGLLRLPIKIKDYPNAGDIVLLPGVTGQTYFDGDTEYKFMHIQDVREWEKS